MTVEEMRERMSQFEWEGWRKFFEVEAAQAEMEARKSRGRR